MKIIGIDSAVKDKNIGMVLCEFTDGHAEIISKWERTNLLEDQLVEWFENDKTLLAIDSPLGWPEEFAKNLEKHVAGSYLGSNDLAFFKRETDTDIISRYNKIPLEVSADRIARTAYFTLLKIDQIKKKTNKKFDILWDNMNFEFGFIEVYPACTLLANGQTIKGYKNDNELRRKIYKELIEIYNIKKNNVEIFEVEHDFDAFVCCLAGIDFLEGKCKKYKELNRKIIKEGWIWCK